jgi:hypothetical protein
VREKFHTASGCRVEFPPNPPPQAEKNAFLFAADWSQLPSQVSSKLFWSRKEVTEKKMGIVVL